jgi:hypothetical protein
MFLQTLVWATLLSFTATAPSAGDGSEKKNDPTPKTAAKVKPGSVDEPADIDGYYNCKGKEAGGKQYSGICVITKKGEVYLVSWMIGSGSTFSGLGIRQGNTLAVSWAIPGDRGVVRGVNLYTIQSGGRLTGRWATLPGPGIQQNETLTFLKAVDDDE